MTMDSVFQAAIEQGTPKFAVGDKVVRISEYWACYDGGFMNKGKEYVVKELLNDREIKLVGSDMDYSASYFELVESAFKNMKGMFTNMKFRVSSPEQSKEIQEALFEMGYVWKSGKTCVQFENDTGYFVTNEDGELSMYDDKYCMSSAVLGYKEYQEYKVETTKSYKLIPVEIPKPEVITIDGKTYDKEAVLKRLAELEVVKN